ncbi:hypothetical protein ACWEFL_25165 [Streptomyces sp. NPDC004838]
MRQLSAPGRLAVALAASLALAATAGCMSVSDGKGGEPAPSKPADRRGAVAEQDGGHSGRGGRHAGGGRAGAAESGGKGDAPDASPSPSGTADPAVRPTQGVNRPQQQPGGPPPTGGGTTPPAEPTVPPEEPPTEPPTDPPTEPTTGPTDPPSASSEPEVHAGAMRLAYADVREVDWEPMASPRTGPL